MEKLITTGFSQLARLRPASAAVDGYLHCVKLFCNILYTFCRMSNNDPKMDLRYKKSNCLADGTFSPNLQPNRLLDYNIIASVKRIDKAPFSTVQSNLKTTKQTLGQGTALLLCPRRSELVC